MKIFKYHLKHDTGEQSVQMPRSAKPISFGLDPYDRGLVVWATVEAENPPVEHRFFLTFTGTEFPAEVTRGAASRIDSEGVMRTPIHRFMGTVKLEADDLDLIVHCFYLDHT